VGDSNQQIYSGSNGLTYLTGKISATFQLRHHYRNGLQICRLADGIAKQTEDYIDLTSTSNYDEKATPSSVDELKCKCNDDMFGLVEKGIDLQLKAYPNELIGILTPRNEELGLISEYIKGTRFYSNGQVQLRGETDGIIDKARPIVVSTIHSAKGLEFRALHLCFLENVKNFPKQRNICYTGVTRAKTALYIYHSGGLPGYMEQAITNLGRPPSLPSIDEVFGREEN
jgi:DNA helicase IV